MKKKKNTNDAPAPVENASLKQPQKKKKEEAPRYRDWEKDRRDRLNVAFNNLAKIVSETSPPVKKIDIIIKACESINELRSENDQIKKANGVDSLVLENETQKFKKQIEELEKRIERLVNLLQDVGCEKPAWVSLPATTPAPPDLGKRPLHYSNKLDPSKVKELLQLPKKTIVKRLQHSRQKKKMKVQVRKKIGVPKVPCTMINQLPPGILLFKTCSPENTPKVLIVPPPTQQTVTTPLILLPPPPKPQLITAKPPLNKIAINSVNHKNARVKKIKKALAVKSSKGIRHSIDALCKKSKEVAAANPCPNLPTLPSKKANSNQPVIPSQAVENRKETRAVVSEKQSEQKIEVLKTSDSNVLPIGKENILTQNAGAVPMIRPPTPKSLSKTLSVANATQSVSKVVSSTTVALTKETFSHQRPAPTPVQTSVVPRMPAPPNRVLPKSTLAQTVSNDLQLPIFSSSSQEKSQQPVFSHSTQAPMINFSENYSFNSSRSYDTQTTFSHLSTSQTPHFHAPLIPTSKEQEQPIFSHENRKNTPFTHETPMQINTAVVSSAASHAAVSQTDTFSHLRTNILPTFSTFGDISGSHCNQSFATSTAQQQKTGQTSFGNTELFTHLPQKQNDFHKQPKSTAPSFSQSFSSNAPTNTSTIAPTFSHEKPVQQQHGQMLSTSHSKPAQFPNNPQRQVHQQQQQQISNNQERPFFFDATRTAEFGTPDASFIGPQPPMATVVEPTNKETLYNPFRPEDMTDGQRNEGLSATTFSNDIFVSLHVPSGHSESISPTAAFLHTFPLVSAGRNTHEENSERVEGAAGNLLQLGSLEEGAQPNSVLELNSLMPTMEDKSKRTKGYSEELVHHYQIESEYDAEISSIMSSNTTKQRQQNKNHQERQAVFNQQDFGSGKNKQITFEYYQQAAYKKRTVAAPQKPTHKETRPREQNQGNFKNNQPYPYSSTNYQTVPSVESSTLAPTLPVPAINSNPINNFMPWNNNVEGQQPQRGVQQNYNCRQPIQQQHQQQKEVQRPPVNWMTNDVRHDEGAVNLFDFDWNKQTPLPTLVGDLALGPNPPTPRKKDNACKYTSVQNFLSVSQLVEIPKEKAKRRLINKAGNGARRVERNQKQNQQPCIDFHSVTNWPAPKPVCKTVPSSYSAEALIGTPQHDQSDKTENNRYNQRFARNYHPGEQNFFPAEQQVEYQQQHHQAQYDCSSMYQPNTSFASIVTSSSSTNSIVTTFNQDLNLFTSAPPRPENKASNNKRRADNFNAGYSDCNRLTRASGAQHYQQQARPNQQINIPPSAATGSSLTNFNLSTIFPEINKPVIAPPLAPFMAPKGQGSASEYVIPPPPNVPFNNLLAPTPPQVSFSAPSFTMPPSLQFPVQHEN